MKVQTSAGRTVAESVYICCHTKYSNLPDLNHNLHYFLQKKGEKINNKKFSTNFFYFIQNFTPTLLFLTELRIDIRQRYHTKSKNIIIAKRLSSNKIKYNKIK